MAQFMYAARPARWIRTEQTENKTTSEWQTKARALQMRRWRALRRASKAAPPTETYLF